MTKLKYVWTKNYENNRLIPEHSHNFYELVFYKNAKGNTTIGNKNFSITPNSFVVIPPSVLHNEKHKGISSLYVVGFETDINIGFYFSKRDSVEINNLIVKIINEQKNAKLGYEELIEIYLKQILIFIDRQKNTKTTKTKSEAISKVVSYLDEYFLMKINLDELAKDIGYCPDRFRIIFKKEVGINPKKYIINKKTDYAKKLLTETNLTIDEIANKLGFSFCSRFSTFFKENVGQSPLDYRRQNTI